MPATPGKAMLCTMVFSLYINADALKQAAGTCYRHDVQFPKTFFNQNGYFLRTHK